MRDFRNLKIWERADKFTTNVYRVTQSFPNDEKFGLTSQIRRGSASMPTNIAEGCGRDSLPEYNRFLQIAMGSSSELDYLLILAHDLSYIDETTFSIMSNELGEIRRMLNAYIQRLKHGTTSQSAKANN